MACCNLWIWFNFVFGVDWYSFAGSKAGAGAHHTITHTHTQATSYLIACSHIRIAYLLQVAPRLLPARPCSAIAYIWKCNALSETWKILISVWIWIRSWSWSWRWSWRWNCVIWAGVRVNWEFELTANCWLLAPKGVPYGELAAIAACCLLLLLLLFSLAMNRSCSWYDPGAGE